MRRCTLLFAAAGAIVCLGALVSTATARSFSISNQTWRATYRALEIRLAEGEAIRCPLTIEGSFHSSSMVKSAGSLIGYVTRVTRGTCSPGTVTVLQATLPWHMQYSAFSGVLSQITSIRVNVIDVGIRVRDTGSLLCLFSSTATEPLTLTLNTANAARAIIGADLAGEFSTPLECFLLRSRITATSTSIAVLNSATLITVRLI